MPEEVRDPLFVSVVTTSTRDVVCAGPVGFSQAQEAS